MSWIYVYLAFAVVTGLSAALTRPWYDLPIWQRYFEPVWIGFVWPMLVVPVLGLLLAIALRPPDRRYRPVLRWSHFLLSLAGVQFVWVYETSGPPEWVLARIFPRVAWLYPSFPVE